MPSTQPSEVVVIGGSAGGLQALSRMIPFLPPDSPAAYVVVIHVGDTSTSALPQVLGTATSMRVAFAEDGASLDAGSIRVAPPGAHTVLTRRSVRLVPGPRVNGHRPAVDTLFRSAASAWGGSTTGVILSGALDDGAAGLAAIAGVGGRTYVQAPQDAVHPGMPRNAVERTIVDGVLSAEAIGHALARQANDAHRVSSTAEQEVVTDRERVTVELERDLGRLEESGADAARHLDVDGANTGLTCPGCGGAIWEVEVDGGSVLRCHVGHAYGFDSFSSEQSVAVEGALWAALRTLEERQILLDRLGRRAHEQGRDHSARTFLTRARQVQRQADVIRQLSEHVMAAESGSAVGEPRTVPA